MTKSQASDMSTMRKLNTLLLLRTLYQVQTASRSDLTRLTDLSSSAVTSIVKDLLNKRLLIEKQNYQQRSVGRPRLPLAINSRCWYVLGLHLSGDNSADLVSFNLQGEYINRIKLSFDSFAPAAVTKVISAGVATLSSKLEPTARLIGLGVSLSGVIAPQTGHCTYSERLNWHKIPLVSLLSGQIDLPIIIERDVNALALAEYMNLEKGEQKSSLAVLMVGNGLGLGLIINGQIYSGVQGGAGEISHILNFTDRDQLDQEQCYCGQPACVSQLISKKGISKQIAKLFPGKTGFAEQPLLWLQDRSKPGNGLSILNRVAVTTALLLKLITETYDPAQIIISSNFQFDRESQQKILDIYGDRLTLPVEFKKEVIFKNWSSFSWAWGAAAVVINNFLNSIDFWDNIK